jgi:hypothetical protein
MTYGLIPRLNLFDPYDVLLQPPKMPNTCFQFTVAYETNVGDACSFQAEDDFFDECDEEWRKRADILQLYQDFQDPCAAFRGVNVDNDFDDIMQFCDMLSDTGSQALYKPDADLDVHNILLSARYHFALGLSAELHLPVIKMKLDNICWKPLDRELVQESFDSVLDPIRALERAGNRQLLHGWERSGVGDLSALISWRRYFPQAKPVLKNVYLSLRGGLVFPTGEESNQNILLGLPFGHDAGVGILADGLLEVWLGSFLRLGFNSRFTHFVGDERERRIQTDRIQTDLIFLQKADSYFEPGFLQHYTLWAQGANLLPGLSARIAYQYTRQEDTEVYLDTWDFDPIVADNAESVQEWKTHNLVVDMTYDWYRPCSNMHPSFQFFFKHGFNGERAILLDTVGFGVSLSF